MRDCLAPTGTGVPTRYPQVLEQFDMLAKDLEILSESASQIEERLTGVVAPCVPTPSSAKQQEVVSPVPLVAKLEVVRSRVVRVNERLQSLLDRLEI